MSATHVAVILRTRTSPAYEEEFMKMSEYLGAMWQTHKTDYTSYYI